MKFIEKILKRSQEIEEHTLKEVVQKYFKMAHSRAVNDAKILKGSQEIEQHTLKEVIHKYPK